MVSMTLFTQYKVNKYTIFEYIFLNIYLQISMLKMLAMKSFDTNGGNTEPSAVKKKDIQIVGKHGM